MSYTIDQFMWPFQRPFQIVAQSSIERIFKKVDPLLTATIFMVAVLKKDIPDNHIICLEPENCGFSQKTFFSLFELVKKFNSGIENFEEKEKIPVAQIRSFYSDCLRRLRNELQSILKNQDPYSEKISYVSFPVEKGDHFVHLVLQLNRGVAEKYYSLRKSRFDNFVLSTSFIDSLARKAIEFIQKEVSLPYAGESFSFNYSEEEIFRRAGNDFFYSVVVKGEMDGWHSAYDAINSISSLKYEGEETNGALIIAPKGHENISVNINFSSPIKLQEYRKIAKLLRLTKKDTFLLSDSYSVYGIGSITGEYNPQKEDLFVVEFVQHHTWQVLHNNSCLMVVSYGYPSLPVAPITKDTFLKSFESLFQDIAPTATDRLFSLLKECCRARHGAIIVISGDAKNEVGRLSKQGFQIEPFPVSVNDISSFSNIDGAVFISPEGYCHGLGIILDGLATGSGDSSRGARYNSALRYLESVKDKIPTILLVVSEDGMVNFLC